MGTGGGARGVGEQAPRQWNAGGGGNGEAPEGSQMECSVTVGGKVEVERGGVYYVCGVSEVDRRSRRLLVAYPWSTPRQSAKGGGSDEELAPREAGWEWLGMKEERLYVPEKTAPVVPQTLGDGTGSGGGLAELRVDSAGLEERGEIWCVAGKGGTEGVRKRREGGHETPMSFRRAGARQPNR